MVWWKKKYRKHGSRRTVTRGRFSHPPCKHCVPGELVCAASAFRKREGSSIVVRRRVADRAAACLAFCVVICCLGVPFAMAGGGSHNVVVVKNLDSPTSVNVANYYIAARGIPPENICAIRCVTSELVSRDYYEAYIAAPIRAFVQKPEIAGNIDYIVLTKGTPLAASVPGYGGPFAITSMLTRLDETGSLSPLTNPYGPTASTKIETSFSHSLLLGGKRFYLVTRLDGYNEQDIRNMIDGSVAGPSAGLFAIDRAVIPSPQSYVMMNNRLATANKLLMAKSLPTVYDDSALFLGNVTGLMGYYGWGSNDASFNLASYQSLRFVPGSIADTYVSSSGRTFNVTSGGQSLMADLIAGGACGVAGFVSEPYTAYSNYPDYLFDRYTKGYNMAESFYASIPELYWKCTVVGDPLMAPYAGPPTVTLNSPETPLTGVATVTATATGIPGHGILKVDYYFDGKYMGFAAQPPYAIDIYTTEYTVGPHVIEVVAFDDSPVATQGHSSTTVNVQNALSKLATIADAFPAADGQGVLATAKPVVAGTEDMGGGEIYVEELNYTGGMRVITTVPVEEGDLVTVSGPLTTEMGERSISGTSVIVVNHLVTPISPVMLPNKAVGGGNLNAQTLGVTGGTGLRNIGTLVRTWGVVTYVGTSEESFFYIDDGSDLDDGSGHSGLRIRLMRQGITKPQLHSKLVVTGVASSLAVGERRIPTLKPRRQSDIVVMSP